ncbi:RHTO0S03e06810g1_1 [Rhodotorula toruloides]|uniref:RHTO0S03e06810g1_1 n=2 Tax=Rhodotorula toruloides TaxID=5286 RepID=A0A061AS88_RHOTO|nr:uncharacterized protein RHTO_00336 [Rhodotorula toruloides NP11]EMS25908.1 hypothetical protein RHTO_00336 [Rhodotorula toruloides NP11]CDR38252.1 RHTO0S03e06810g1_1 [Rhodotorula toruloides]
MSLVRPAARALASTSSQSCGARSLARAFSTSRAVCDDTDRGRRADAIGGIRARPISLKKAAEAAGSTDMLIAQALERTSRPPAGAAERRPGAGAGAGAGQAPRAPGMHREELQRLLAERKAAAARGIKESALRGPGAGGPGGPRFGGPRPGGPGGPGGARFGGPRRGGQGAGAGPGGAPNPYAPVRRPPRKSFKPRFERVVSEYKPPWTKEELTPRKPPATVDTPKLQLDALVAANTYVRNSIAEQICKEVKLKPFSSNPKERAAAEKIFQGDYSQFLVRAPGKDKDGKDEVLARAMEALLHNPTVSFARRQEFVDKMRESMPQ